MQNPIDIGTNRQLFLDDLHHRHQERREGGLMHSPTRRETVLVGDKPWDEASVCVHVRSSVTATYIAATTDATSLGS